ncbi:MAG: MauE/DoxX family redox-associated membrane protein [Bacteroidota bacterium]
MKKPLLLQILSIIIGTVFIVSGIGKAFNTTAFAYIIYEYHFGYAFFAAPVIPVIEVLLGLMLIFKIYRRTAALLSGIMLLIFSIIFAYGYWAHQIEDCGCFGEIRALQLSPWITFTRNIVLLIMSVFIMLNRTAETQKQLTLWKAWIVFPIIIGVALLSGFSFKLTADESDTTHPWQGKAIKDTKLPLFIHTNPDSTYLCFVFSWKCFHCWNSIENVKSYKAYHVVDSIIGISMHDDKNEARTRKYFDINFPVIKTSRDSTRLLTEVLPTMFIISRDTIKVAFQSEIPSHLTLLSSSLGDSK